MTKRLISLMLAVLMLVFALVSCGSDEDAIDDTVNEASRYTSTINMWVITESALVERASELLLKGNDPDKYPEETSKQTDEQKAFLAGLPEGLEEAWRQLDDICDQINVLTKKRFKTQVNIKYFTEESYYTKLEAAFRDMAAAKAEAETTGKPLFPEVAEDETVTNDHGVPGLKYPHAWDAQVDVLFLGGSQHYYNYITQGWLAEINEDIPESAGQLEYHLTSSLLYAPQYNGKTYAVSNNNALGEYTYIAVDTALMQEYYALTDAMNDSLYSSETKQFLDYVYNRPGSEKVYPIYSENGKVDLELIHYWSYNPDVIPGEYVQTPNVFSLYGTFYTKEDTPASWMQSRNVLTQEAYISALEKKVYYENTAEYITQDATAKAALRVVKGGYGEKAKLESMGYTVITSMAPRISDEDVFSSMFAIGAVTRDKNRNLEIIAMLNTEPEIRNLLQYGIENVNYTLKTAVGADGKEHVYAEMKDENMYEMDIAKTGNMFVAYPNAAKSDLANGKYGVDEWEYNKKQNLQATLYPTVALNFNAAKVDDKSLRVLNAVSAQFKTNVLDVLTTPAQVQDLKANAAAANTSNLKMAAWLLSVTGEVTYVPEGKTVAVPVTVEDLAIAITGMSSNYNANMAAQDVLCIKLLYDEWWMRNNTTDQ